MISKVTEAALVAAAHNHRPGVMELLLVRDQDIKITKAVWVASAENHSPGVMQLLLDRGCDIEMITERAFLAVAKYHSRELMELLLARNHDIKITEAALVAAAGNDKLEVMELLLAGDNDIKITEAVLVAAAMNYSPGVMELLLARYHDIQITEAVWVAAAKMRAMAIEALVANDQVTITGAAFVAVAKYCSPRVMKLLLAKDPNIKITEEIFLATIDNRTHGKELIELLLRAEGHDIEITQRVLSKAWLHSLEVESMLEKEYKNLRTKAFERAPVAKAVDENEHTDSAEKQTQRQTNTKLKTSSDTSTRMSSSGAKIVEIVES